MAEKPKLNHPWLVAVWPGMGHVALNAGYYLLVKLDMHVIAEFEVANLFDVDHVEVKEETLRYASKLLADTRSEEHTSELQSLRHLVCRLLLEKKNKKKYISHRHRY